MLLDVQQWGTCVCVRVCTCSNDRVFACCFLPVRCFVFVLPLLFSRLHIYFVETGTKQMQIEEKGSHRQMSHGAPIHAFCATLSLCALIGFTGTITLRPYLRSFVKSLTTSFIEKYTSDHFKLFISKGIVMIYTAPSIHKSHLV